MREEQEEKYRREERRRYEEKRRRRRKRLRRRRRLRIVLLIGIPLLLVLAVWFGTRQIKKLLYEEKPVMAYEVKYVAQAPDYQVELLDYNEYSRPGTALSQVNGIVIHYTANPGTTAEQNRSYFENLKDTGETYASSHFVIGMDGEIVQCIPTWEVAYASNDRNYDTVSIECCHPDATGKFNDATYRSMVQLTAWLCLKFNLTEEDVIRHYDVTGKICPKYFVENEGAWDQFRKDVKSAMAMNKNPE